MQREKAQFRPIDLLKYGTLIFLFFAFLERVYNFHYKRLFSPLPYGYIIGRDGKIPSLKNEKIIFKKKFLKGKKTEIRAWFWGKDRGVLKINGEVFYKWDKPDIYFLRIPGEKLREENEIEVEVESEIGFVAFWFSDISGLGTDRSWECFYEGKKLKIRIFGKPPYKPLL